MKRWDGEGMVTPPQWGRHGQNVVNLTRTLSFQVFDGDLTDALLYGRHGNWASASRPALQTRFACWPARRCAAPGRRRNRGSGWGCRQAMELDDLRDAERGRRCLDGRRYGDRPGMGDRPRELLWPGARVNPGQSSRAARTATSFAARSALGSAYGGGTQRRGQASIIQAPPDSTAAECSLVVAHGANLRAALPCVAGEPDPGTDLPTGGLVAVWCRSRRFFRVRW